jgi:NTE family protein
MKKYTLGIALSGGGSRGFAHLGAMKALHEKGIVPEVISGASAGSIAGSLIADGKSPDEAFELLKSKGFFHYTSIRFPRSGFFSLKGLAKQLEKAYEAETIERLKTPLFIALTNLNTGRIEYKSSGPLLKTVIASSSIPVMFEPVEIDGQSYIDGGLLENLPHTPLKDICEKIIAVNLIPVKQTKNVRSMKKIISRVLDLTVNLTVDAVRDEADVFIEPPGLMPYGYLNSKEAKEVFDIGYEFTKNLEIKL